MPKIRAGIINVTGYIGAELARLLCQHPQVRLVTVTGRSAAGQKLADVFPSLAGANQAIEAELDGEIDIVFSAMPHKSIVDIVPALLRKGTRVVDASADFRLKNADKYPRWYGFTHPSPRLLKEAFFGLPELHHDEIASASLVANPGCYSTSAILALAAVVKEGLIRPDIAVDSKSGVSGAGRTLSLTTHYRFQYVLTIGNITKGLFTVASTDGILKSDVASSKQTHGELLNSDDSQMCCDGRTAQQKPGHAGRETADRCENY